MQKNKYNLPSHYAWLDGGKLPDLPVWVTRSMQRDEIPSHSHDYLELALVVSGSAFQTLRDLHGKRYSFWVFQGDVFAILPGETHEYDEGHDFALYNCSLRSDCLDGALRFLYGQEDWLDFTNSGENRRKRHLDVNSRHEAGECLDRVIEELNARPQNFREMATAKITEFVIGILRGIPSELTAHRNGHPGILKTVAYMEEHPEQAHTLEKLSLRAAMGVSTYTRRFRQEIGLSPGQYLQKLRMEIVKQQLCNTERSEIEIAERCGLDSANYMIRIFRRHYGMTPAAYRKKLDGFR